MKQQKISNEKLDAIGTMLLEAGKLTPDDIERIADRPFIFAGVFRGIDAEKSTVGNPRVALWRRALVLAPAASVAIGMAAYLALAPGSGKVTPAAEDEVNTVMPSMPAETAKVEPSATGTASVRTPRIAKAAGPAPRRAAVRRERAVGEEMSDFYALTYDGGNDDDLRMVRVELPRTSILAMGINIHLESETEKVKTDLLVGPDGVPRALRFAK